MKEYKKPLLVEYGRIGQLTLGSGGSQPDYVLTGTGIKLIADNCFTLPPATACIGAGSS